MLLLILVFILYCSPVGNHVHLLFSAEVVSSILVNMRVSILAFVAENVRA